MVDIFKPAYYPSKIHNLRYNPTSHQVTLPVFLSNVHSISLNDRVKNNNTKRWIDHYPPNPARLLDVSNAPYSLHRKVMNQELSRQAPTIVGLNGSVKTKQPTVANTSSQSTFNNGDTQGTRLFDALSKHVTIKAEPLRSTNSFANSSTTTLTSWQRYWTSTNTQRRRKEANETEPVLHRPKREQSVVGQTHFVVLRDSPKPTSEHHTDSRTPSTPPSSCTPTKLSQSATPDKQISSTIEDDITKEINQVSIIDFVTSSSNVTNSCITTSKKSTDRDDEKSLPFLSSSSLHFKSDSQIIQEVSDAQNQISSFTTKVYRLPLPVDKPKNKKILLRRQRTRSRSKSIDKKDKRIPSTSKRNRRISTTNKSSLSSVITTTPRSKYSEPKWDEPYVGLRIDPPTPRCSPTLFVWPQDSDPDEDDTTLVKSEVFEHYSTVKVLENCMF